MDIKRRFAMTVILGTGVGLTGCQGGGLGKLAIWNRGDSSVASTAPDVSRQKYSGLAQEFGSAMPMGQNRPGTAALGGQKPPSDDNFFTASWKKTTAAVGGAFGSSTTKSANPAPEDDPLRLDRQPKKINADVYVSAARLLENQGKYDEAELKYQDALKSSPDSRSQPLGLPTERSNSTSRRQRATGGADSGDCSSSSPRAVREPVRAASSPSPVTCCPQ